jgi:hypothetical protein
MGRRSLLAASLLAAGLVAGSVPAGVAAATSSARNETTSLSARTVAASSMVTGHSVIGSVKPVAPLAGGGGTSATRGSRSSHPRIIGMSRHSGPVTGGEVVTITGSNLSPVKAVDFGQLHARVLTHSTGRRLRVRSPASWAGSVRVRVTTAGGITPRSAAGRFTFRNPAPQSTSALTASDSDVVATGSDVTAVTGGQADISGNSTSQAPWVVTLAAAATVPAVGQGFVMKPGSPVFPSGLAGTVTAVDSTASPATITVAAPSASLDSVVQSAEVNFSGPLGDPATATRHPVRVVIPHSTARGSSAGSNLASTIDFGSISASALHCGDSDGASVSISGSLSLTLQDVQSHVEVDTGSAWSKPFVDVWVSYQPTIAFNLTASGQAECSLPAAWQNSHQKLFVLGDTGATIAIAPDVTFTVSVGGTITAQQHSYRMMGFTSNPDGSIRRFDGESSDPAQVSASGTLEAEAYGGVHGELDVVGVGMSIGGGIKGTVEEQSHPSRTCLSITPFLKGSLYAFLNVWVSEWKLEAFQVELDLSRIGNCTSPSPGWHVAWQSKTAVVFALACPTTSECVGVGRTAKHGYILRTQDAGRTWTGTTIDAYTAFYGVACADAQHCIAGGNGGKVAVTSDGGASWSEVSLPYVDSPLAVVSSVACVPGGTCYAAAGMTRYSGTVIYGSTDNGQTWTYDSLPLNSINAMTCISSSSCIGVGSVPPTYGSIIWPAASQATNDSWASSATGSFPNDWKSLTSVACLSATLCYTTGSDLNNDGDRVLATTNFGATWEAVPDGKLSPWAMSCPTQATCVFGGGQSVVTTTNGGQSWTKTGISNFPPADGMSVFSIACASQSTCMAGEFGGNNLSAIVAG